MGQSISRPLRVRAMAQLATRAHFPWKLPNDLKRFKALYHGQADDHGPQDVCLAARGCCRGRRHIVLTRDALWSAPGAEVAHDVAGALALAGDGEIAVIGGADVLAQFEPHAQRYELTEVHGDYAGDTVLPYPAAPWRDRRETHPAQGAYPAQ
jgi:dihydrofolate reductase